MLDKQTATQKKNERITVLTTKNQPRDLTVNGLEPESRKPKLKYGMPKRGIIIDLKKLLKEQTNGRENHN